MVNDVVYPFKDEDYNTNVKTLYQKFQSTYYRVKNNLDKLPMSPTENNQQYATSIIGEDENQVEIYSKPEFENKDKQLIIKNKNVGIEYNNGDKYPTDYDLSKIGIVVKIDGMDLPVAAIKKGPEYCFEKAAELDKTVQVAINPYNINRNNSVREAHHNMQNPNPTIPQ